MSPITQFLYNRLQLATLVKLSGQNLALPLYHVVSAAHLPHVAHLYTYKKPKAFEADLDFLLSQFTPVSLHDLLAKARNGKITFDKPVFHLTFDDGLKECVDIIAPMLQRKGIPATFFLNSAFVDNRALFYRYKVSLIMDEVHHKGLNKAQFQEVQNLMPEGARKPQNTGELNTFLLSLQYEHQYFINQIAEIFEIDFGQFLRHQKPYMGKSEVRQLLADGFTIGAHSVDHPYYQRLDLEEQMEQTRESMRYIQEVFQPGYGAFAFPFTDYGVSQKLFAEIYKRDAKVMPVEISFGTAGVKSDLFPQHLQRIAMEGNYPDAETTLKSAYLRALTRQGLGKNTIKRA